MDILWIVVQIISISFGFICVLALSRWRFTKNTTFIVTAVFLILMTGINYFCVRDLSYLLEEYPIMDFVYRSSNILISLLVACILIRQQAVQMIFTILSVLVNVLIVDTFAITIRICFGMYQAELFWELLLYSSMIFLVIQIRKFFLEVVEYMKERLWPLCIVPFLLTVCFFLQISVPIPLERSHNNMPVAIMLCFISLSVYGIFFVLFRLLRSQGHQEQNMIAMKLYASSLEHQNNIASQNEKKLTIIRHDLRHIVQILFACLNDGDMEGARNLIQELDMNLQVTEGRGIICSFTGHKLLDATIHYYIDSAKESGIHITVRMDKIDHVSADKTELAVVFANALENAVRACNQLPEGEERVIHLDGHWHGGQYFLELVNKCTGQVIFDPNTKLPVSNEEGHGLGSQSIAYFARKHGVVLQYHLEGCWFHLRLLMGRHTMPQEEQFS